MSNSINHRLDKLPARAAAPFRQLLRTGQINDDVINHILDAGELAQDNSKLIGFAAGYLYLRSESVPVHDVIRMAKEQKRRINLAWSAKRWKEEHDRLGRAEALRQMATENTTYDLSIYEPHLPPNFNGYLIRSSRRLGMEGFRQRHCVASYHHHIVDGTCAIATVFVNQRRWTVELRTSDEAGTPLRINQIKTRCNTLPSADVRKKIHDLLGIPLPIAPPTVASQPTPERSYKENLRRILPILNAAGVCRVMVCFEGSGDNGSIEDLQYSPIECEAVLKGLTTSCMTRHSAFDDGRWTTTETLRDLPVRDAIEELTYDYLEETGVDWQNNDGGFGELEIDITEGVASLTVHTRYTQSEIEHSTVLDIETGVEE